MNVFDQQHAVPAPAQDDHLIDHALDQLVSAELVAPIGPHGYRITDKGVIVAELLLAMCEE